MNRNNRKNLLQMWKNMTPRFSYNNPEIEILNALLHFETLNIQTCRYFVFETKNSSGYIYVQKNTVLAETFHIFSYSMNPVCWPFTHPRLKGRRKTSSWYTYYRFYYRFKCQRANCRQPDSRQQIWLKLHIIRCCPLCVSNGTEWV